MEHFFGQDWEIVPAGGATGEAFFARHQEQELFLKRNSSPFLAVLSAEGIVPKLIWTKRLENGDVITAQQWLSGRELKPADMKNERVAKLLKKIHGSRELLSMLERLGKRPYTPGEMLDKVEGGLDQAVISEAAVKEALRFLRSSLPGMNSREYVVCHGDVNHNNWLLSDLDELFLIDWDGAVIADPALDLGMLLHWYIPPSEWEEWLATYGIRLTEALIYRMNWYIVAQTIDSVQWHKDKGRFHEMSYWLQDLEKLLKQ